MASKTLSLSRILGESSTGTIPVESLSTNIVLGANTYATAANLPVSGNNTGDQAFVSSTGRLYIWTGTGWYNIALVNSTPTWDSNGEPASNYDLAIDGTATVITLLASDPEGLVISYTATTDSGLDAIASISQDSNQFTITPLFQLDDDSATNGVGTITFRATDGVNILPAVSTFEITFAIEDSKYTTLLLKTNETDASQNNTFLDSSTNNFTLTRAGNAIQGSFSPYGDKWSNYFDGVGDVIYTEQNSAFNIGTDDFTFEAYIYPNSFTTDGWNTIFSVGNTTNFGGLLIGKGADNTFVIRKYGTGNIVSTATLPEVNDWTHIAGVRSSGTSTIYYNGVSIASAADTTNYTTATPFAHIGNSDHTTYSHYFKGYIADARFVSSAVYTSNFTPPAKPLTAITDTELLTCQSNQFKDNSTNNYTITKANDVKVTRFSPYDKTVYNPTTDGGSGYFDGNGDYLQPTADVLFESDDFTIEGWFNFNSVSGQALVSKFYNFSSNLSWELIYVNSQLYFQTNTGSFNSGAVSWVPNISEWYHIAAVRSGSNKYLFINGVLRSGYPINIGTGSIQGESGYIARIGARLDNSNYFNGYISDLRIIKGTALYTSNFTPPTEPLTSITNTTLLCNFTNAGIYDASTNNTLETVGNAQVDTAVTKFGTGSMYFDGTGDWLTFDQQVLDGGDFTVEGWVNLSVLRDYQVLFDNRATGTSSTGLAFGATATGAPYLYTNSGFRITSSILITAATWNHIALTRSGSTINIWVNGTSGGTYTSTASFSDINCGIGVSRTYTPTSQFYGYIEDLRITKGLARYTTGFTPPVVAFKA